jgi:hypothetical protein
LLGTSVKNNSVPLTALGKIFDQVQKLLYATAEIASDEKSPKGGFTKDLISKNTLLVQFHGGSGNRQSLALGPFVIEGEAALPPRAAS